MELIELIDPASCTDCQLLLDYLNEAGDHPEAVICAEGLAEDHLRHYHPDRWRTMTMTVSEAIAELSKMPPTAEIRRFQPEDSQYRDHYQDLVGVELVGEGNTAYVELSFE